LAQIAFKQGQTARFIGDFFVDGVHDILVIVLEDIQGPGFGTPSVF
jgi:hypothetical protein